MQIRAITRIADLQDSNLRAPVLEAKMALARIAYSKGDEVAADSIQKELAAFDIKRPMLIYSPSYRMVQRELDTGSDFAFPFGPQSMTGGEAQDGASVRSGPQAPTGGNPNGLEGSAVRGDDQPP